LAPAQQEQLAAKIISMFLVLLTQRLPAEVLGLEPVSRLVGAIVDAALDAGAGADADADSVAGRGGSRVAQGGDSMLQRHAVTLQRYAVLALARLARQAANPMAVCRPAWVLLVAIRALDKDPEVRASALELLQYTTGQPQPRPQPQPQPTTTATGLGSGPGPGPGSAQAASAGATLDQVMLVLPLITKMFESQLGGGGRQAAPPPEHDRRWPAMAVWVCVVKLAEPVRSAVDGAPGQHKVLTPLRTLGCVGLRFIRQA